MGIWQRVFAAIYERSVAGAEREGIARERAALLAQCRGRVLEIGAGTGLNVEHYPAGAEVTYTEPSPHMAKRLRARGVAAVEAEAGSLPFEDGSFDTVVSTLVLCTVPDVAQALREIRRVLAPGGSLLFLEHVRAPEGTPLARWQDRLHRPWRAVGCGCNCNRDLLGMLAQQSFGVVASSREWTFMPAIVRPVVVGVATPGL